MVSYLRQSGSGWLNPTLYLDYEQVSLAAPSCPIINCLFSCFKAVIILSLRPEIVDAGGEQVVG